MKKIFCLIGLATVLFWILPSGCAVIVPPTGGPKDTIPPVFMGAIPKDSSLNFKAKTITIDFNEYINLDNAFTNVIVSPIPKTTPSIERNQKQITIKIKDTLEPNTTYAFDFGNSIKDVNEGNAYKNFTYVFSTGDKLDTISVSGIIKSAETGEVDTSLVAVLYSNLSDTAIYKARPKYYAKLDSTGRFVFRFLPKEKFHLFAVENTYMKNYADSTTMFAFADNNINTGEDSSYRNIRMYAFQAYKKAEKKSIPPKLSAKQIEKKKEGEAKKPLTVQADIPNGKQSLLTPIEITYSKPLKHFDSTKILLTDTNFVPVKNIQVYHDSTDTLNTKFFVQTQWLEDSNYKLIIPADAASDSFDVKLTKADTVSFQAKNKDDYASVKLTFADVDTTQNPVLQIFSSDKKMVDSIRIPASKTVSIPMFEPGKYNFKILYDKNDDMKWTPGNYKQRLQPEIVIAIKHTFEFLRAIDNEWDNILLIEPEQPKYKPINL